MEDGIGINVGVPCGGNINVEIKTEINMTVKGKVTAAVLREMEPGKSITFELPDADAVNTGKAIAYRMKHILKCRFKCVSDFETNKLTITKTTE